MHLVDASFPLPSVSLSKHFETAHVLRCDRVGHLGLNREGVWVQQYPKTTESDDSRPMRIPTTPQRSRMMSSIRGKNTLPERTLRSQLFGKGFRYRLHVRKLPGSPDIVFPKHHAVVFVHGCFWHRHNNCRYTTTPRSNVAFWQQKFQGNIARDECHTQELLAQGWRVAVVWECALKCSPERAAAMVETWLLEGNDTLNIGQEEVASFNP